MRRYTSFWAGFVTLGLLLPTFAGLPDDEKKKPGDEKTDSKDKTEKKDKTPSPETPPTKEKPEVKEKLTSLGKIQGKLVRIEGTQRILKVCVTTAVPRPRREGNRVNMHYERVESNVDVVPHDDLKVRSMQPPVVFDDKGNRRPLTAKEKQDLRGTDRLPGYAVDFDSLKLDQIVEVHLASRKTPAELRAMSRTPAKAKAKTKGSETDETLEGLGDDKPLATVIVILAEPVK